MKRLFVFQIFVAIVLFSCTRSTIDIEVETKPVKVIAAGIETRTVFYRNIGTVISSDIKKLGFKIPGKIESISVKRGNHIKRGAVLARLEQRDYNFALEAAENTYRKAEDYYNETASFYSRIKDLYESQAVPESDHDKAKMAMDVARSDMENARVAVEHKKSVVSDAVLVSNTDGFVVEVLNRRGEVVAAGYPVVVIRNESLIVRAAVPSKNLKDIKIGTVARVEIDGALFKGKVTEIAQIPNDTTRTYSVDIAISSVEKPDLRLGAVAKVDFNIGEEKGVWVPVFSLLTDGTDFVFVNKNGFALRKNVNTGFVSGEFVLVEGLDEGDRVVVEGMKEISDGDRVKEI